MNGNPVVWFEIYVQDMQRARNFYETVFKVSLQELESPVSDIEMLSFPSDMNKYGISGALAKMNGVPSGGGTLVYFHCDDCAIEEQRAAQAGGSIHKSKTSIGPYGYFSLVQDTEGNLIGLHSMK